MKDIILQILQLWDPYNLYLFPNDEYLDFVNPIYDTLKTRKTIEIQELSEFIFNLIPPIENSESLVISKVEYERVSRLLITLIIEN